MAFVLFAVGVAACVLMLGIHDVYADDTVVEHHEAYKSERVVESDDDAVIEKRTKIEEKRTTVEAVPAPKVVERRTTVEAVPAPAVIEKRTVETVEED